MSRIIPSVRWVIRHEPGERWIRGTDFREQQGVGEHAQHYRKFAELGRLELGGPFLLEDSGGMVVTIKGLAKEEVVAFAAADPAVKSGLLKFEVLPWLTPMERRND